MAFDVAAARALVEMYMAHGEDRPVMAQAAILDACDEIEALRAQLAEAYQALIDRPLNTKDGDGVKDGD